MSRASQVALSARQALARHLGSAGRRRTLRERELAAVEGVYSALSRADDAEGVARALLDEIAELLEVEFVGLSLVDYELGEAHGLLARRDRQDFELFRGFRFPLDGEPSGVATAVLQVAPVVVPDLAEADTINHELAEAVGATSAAWVPLVSGERVIAVLTVATTVERRTFSAAELGPLRALTAEATLALERARAAAELGDALERERLVSEIGRRVREEFDPEELQRVAVEETGRALGVDRCYIRTDAVDGTVAIVAEWHAPDLEPVGDHAPHLPVANLAARLGDTVAVGDVESTELELHGADGREMLLSLGSRSVLATPIRAFDQTIGVFALHRRTAGQWLDAEVALAEAVAREVGLAIHTASLLRENDRRISQQAALLRAGQVLASELRAETVQQLLVDEVAELLRADAADCYLYDMARDVLTCVAIRGLDRSVLGAEFPATQGISGRAIMEAGAVVAREYEEMAARQPHPAYAEFVSALVVPMVWSGETRGVLGVGSRDPSRRFDDADADLLRSFGSLASLALRNAEAFEQRERQARIERGFARMAALLGESVSLAETQDALAHAAAEALGGEFAVVLMPGGRGLRAAGADELPEELAGELADGLPAGGEVLAAVARDGRLLTSGRLADDERFGEPFSSLAQRSGCAALLAAPLAAPRPGGGGVVLVGFAEPKRFTDDEVALAQQLASAARGALERSELFETERRARALSQQLTAISSRLGAKLEPAAVLREVAAQAPTLLGADACSIRLLEDDALVVRAAAGREAEELAENRGPAGSGLAADVLRSSGPVAVPDVSRDTRLGAGEPFLDAGYDAYLGVPLRGQEGRLEGVLAVYSRAARVWRSEESEALTSLAVAAGAAVSNAELYQRVALERERSFAILRNVADGIVAVDREGRVVLWNAAAEAITGVPSEEALGRSVPQVLQRDLAGPGLPARERDVTIRRGSEEVHLSLTEAVMRDPAGDVAGRVFAFRDVSSEHVVEQMKTDFVSTVSHELRAPLTSIYGFAETLLRSDVDFSEDERRTFLGYVASEASRLTAIVDQLLNVARLDSGDLAVELAATDVRPVIAEIVESVGQSALANGHQFVVDLPEEPVRAHADEQKLRQVLVNLVENAVKFSPAGATVSVAAQRLGDVVELRVADEGQGIPQSERDRIFAKFYRVASSAPTGGTGLGLSIVQGLLAAMGGTIRVDSVEGEGSVFVVELPAAGVASPAREPEAVA